MSAHEQSQDTKGGTKGGRRATPERLQMATSVPVRKLRVGGLVGIAAALLLPLVNAALARLGLPAVTAEDVRVAWDLGLAAYGAVAAVVVWVAAYLARPGRSDVPVPDYRAEAKQRERASQEARRGRVGW